MRRLFVDLLQILRLCSRYDLDKDVMLFNGGLSLDREQLQKGGFGTLTDTIFRFASSLKVLNIDEMEYAVLSAICLISGGTNSLTIWIQGLFKLPIINAFFGVLCGYEGR